MGYKETYTLDNGTLSRIDGKSIRVYRDKKGYLYASRKGGGVNYLHRVVFFLGNGYMPETVDHIDGDKENNHPSNLRAATISENNRNVGMRKANTSGFKGVTRSKRGKPWRAQIKFNGDIYYLGLFDDPLEAAIAYDEKCIELHGDFAMTNKMMGNY